MIALLGQAEAGARHRTLAARSLHSFVAMVRCTDTQEAVERLTRDLLAEGFVAVTVEEATAVPRWRGLLPTVQGRQIREAMLHGPWIWIYQDDNRTEEADP